MKHEGMVLTVEPHGIVPSLVMPVPEIEQTLLHLTLQIHGNIGMVGKGSQDMREIREIEIAAVASLVDEGDLASQDMFKLILRSACMQDCHRPVCITLAVSCEHFEGLLLAFIHGWFGLGNQGEGKILKSQVISHAHPLHPDSGLELQVSDGKLLARTE